MFMNLCENDKSVDIDFPELLDEVYHIDYNELIHLFSVFMEDYDEDYFSEEQWEVCIAMYIMGFKLGHNYHAYHQSVDMIPVTEYESE